MGSPALASRTSTLADASRSLLASRPTRAVLAGSLADTGDAAIKPAKTMASRVFMNLELRKPSQFITCPDRLCQTTQRIKGLHDNGLPTNGGAKGSSGDFAVHFRLLVLLEGPHAGIRAAAREQLEMRATLDDPAALEDEDLIRADDRRKAVRDGQRGPVRRDLLELGLNQLLRLGVERRGRLVEDEQPRRLENGARDRDALFFAAGELQSPLAHRRAVALGEARHEIVD